MKKFLKWTGFVAAAIGGLVLIGIAWVYFASQGELMHRYEVAAVPVPALPTSAAEIAEGRRLATLGGCLHCHGEDLSGRVVDDIPHLLRLVAPNISARLPNYSDTQIATVLRKGVKPDGTSVVFMPSEMFRHFSDEDLARLIAWLRTVPATPAGIQEKTEVRVLGRLILAKGDVKLAAKNIQSLPAPVSGFDAGTPASHGRYLVMSFCSECHGQDLGGFAAINAPPLVVAKGYSAEQFSRLMHEGIALGDRDLKMMSSTARARFASFTPEEVAAIYQFLMTRP